MQIHWTRVEPLCIGSFSNPANWVDPRGLCAIKGAANAALNVVYQALATTYDLEQVIYYGLTGDIFDLSQQAPLALRLKQEQVRVIYFSACSWEWLTCLWSLFVRFDPEMLRDLVQQPSTLRCLCMAPARLEGQVPLADCLGMKRVLLETLGPNIIAMLVTRKLNLSEGLEDIIKC